MMASSAVVNQPTEEKVVSEIVVSAVAELTNSDPVSITPLFDVVDPDALNAFFTVNQSGFNQSPDRVSFTYCDCDVVISAEGTVRISRSEEEIVKNWL